VLPIWRPGKGFDTLELGGFHYPALGRKQRELACDEFLERLGAWCLFLLLIADLSLVSFSKAGDI
jgi:hypothetical protein